MRAEHDWPTINEICLRALDMPLDARAEFLRRRCDGDPSLEHRVAELLVASETDDDFLLAPDLEQLWDAESTVFFTLPVMNRFDSTTDPDKRSRG